MKKHMKKRVKTMGTAAIAAAMTMSTGMTAYALPVSGDLIVDKVTLDENWNKEKGSQANVEDSMTISVNGTYTDQLEASKVISADVA